MTTTTEKERLIKSATSKPPAEGDRAAADEAFAAEVFSRCVEEHRTLYQFFAFHPVLSLKAIAAIRRLPALAAELPPEGSATTVARLLGDQPRGRFLTLGATAVLRTPTVPGTYLEGHERATVRRKVRAARKRGVQIRPVPQEDRPHLLSLANSNEQHNEREEYRVSQPTNDDLLNYDLWFAAYDSDDRPIMLSVTPYAGEWGVLRYFRTLEPSNDASDARYLLTDALAEELGTRGVRYLADSARPHWLPNGLRHFQRMVGFRLVRVPTIRVTGS